MTWDDDGYDGVQYDDFYAEPASEWRGKCGQCGSRDCTHVPSDSGD